MNEEIREYVNILGTIDSVISLSSTLVWFIFQIFLAIRLIDAFVLTGEIFIIPLILFTIMVRKPRFPRRVRYSSHPYGEIEKSEAKS